MVEVTFVFHLAKRIFPLSVFYLPLQALWPFPLEKLNDIFQSSKKYVTLS